LQPAPARGDGGFEPALQLGDQRHGPMVPPGFLWRSWREHVEHEPRDESDIERHEHAGKDHITQKMPPFTHADEPSDAAGGDCRSHQLGTPAAGKQCNGKTKSEGRRGLAADEGAIPLATAGTLERRREVLWPTKLGDIEGARPAPMVF